MTVTITVTLHTEYLAGGWRIIFTTPDGEQSVSTHCWLSRDLADKALEKLLPEYLASLAPGGIVKRVWLEKRQNQQECLCILGCSVNGECPIHGDKAAGKG